MSFVLLSVWDSPFRISAAATITCENLVGED